MSTVVHKRDVVPHRHTWPTAQINRTPTTFEVEIETPEHDERTLFAEIEGHTLAVLGAPDEADEDSGFNFTFDLPPNTNLARVRARFEDGVLTVTAPLLAENGHRVLEIEVPSLVNPTVTGL